MDILNKANVINTKLYFWSIGFYAYVILIIGLRGLLLTWGLHEVPAFFIAACIAVLLRIAYEHLIVFKALIEAVDYIKVIVFVLVNAAVFAILSNVVKGIMGAWAVFAVIGVGQKIMDILKQNVAWLAHAHEYRKTNVVLAAKIQDYVSGLYWFFGILAGLAYFGVKHAGQKMFFPIFAGALFVALVYNIITEQQSIYENPGVVKRLWFVVMLAFIFSCITTALMFGLMFGVGLSGKTVSVAGVIILKLIQPLVINKLFLKS